MKRDIIKIDEDLCNGCGVCVPNCHEGALQVIDGKVRLVSDLMCDGLGACIGHCPLGAIEIEQREAEPYNETLVMKDMIPKGKNTIIAHLKHLKDYNEFGFLKEGITYLKENADKLDFDVQEIISAVNNTSNSKEENTMKPEKSSGCGGGCPGSQTMSFGKPVAPVNNQNTNIDPNQLKSELTQWPVQMHLVNPNAPYYRNNDVVIAADCVAFSLGNFHQKYLKGKGLAIACPKLDSNQDSYLDKLVQMIDIAEVNTINVMIMEVPCCGGLLQVVKKAASIAKRKVPVKCTVVGIQGNIVSEEWI